MNLVLGAELPMGVVSLVFTDIEGSTRLLQQLGDAFGVVLAEHHRLLRRVWEDHGGVEVNTDGDAFFVAFDDPGAAVRAAAAAQRALAVSEWPPGVEVRVRMGVHTGTPKLRDGDYWGIDVHYAARLCAAANGGQVLVSASTAGLVEAEVEDLGEHALKDFPSPRRVFHLLVDGKGADAFPPPRTRRTGRPNLPDQLLSLLGAAASVSLVGRAGELSALDEWLRGVSAGRAGLGLIEGGPGMGKSRLAGTLVEAAVGAWFSVFSARADELDRDRPFGALADALEFVPEVPDGSVAVPGLEYRLVDQIVERVEALALEGPVLVWLEDLHWADSGTVVALRALGRRLAHLPLALLGTFRPWPRSAELERLIEDWRSVGALHLVLDGLEHARVLELAAELIGAPVGPTLERQLAKAAGTPLFVCELVGALQDDGAIELTDGLADLAGESLPPSLQLTILRRVGLLGDEALSLLRVASVLGTTFSLADLATVTGREVAVVLVELLDARRAGVVEEVGAMLRFRHDLVREALYADLPESARRALHRDAGRSLARAGAPRLQVAEQLSLGASPGDRETIGWLRDAAEECVLRAPQTAVALLERAAGLVEPDDPARDQLLADLADGLVWCGRPSEGQSLAADLLAHGAGGSTREQARATVVRGLWLDGRWRELVEEVDRWLAAAESELTPHARGRMLADQAMAAVFGGDVARAEKLGLRALRIGEQLGDDAVVFQALYALGPVHNFRGRKQDELAVAERALEIVERGTNPDLVRFHPHFGAGMALAGNDRHEQAESTFETGLRIREALGTVWDLPLYQAGLADLHCQMGKWDEALVEAETGVEIAGEVGTRLAIVVCAGVAAWIRAHRDDVAEADRLLAIAQGEIDRAGPQWGSYWVILATAQLADAGGDQPRALEVLQDGWAANEHSPGLRIYLAPKLVGAALAAGSTELARSIADMVASYAPDATASSARGNLLLARGLVDHDAELLAQAAAAFRSGDSPYDVAVANEATATATAAHGDTPAARPLFEDALQTYERIGARRDIGRALAAMRAAGIRRGSRVAHRQDLKGWGALTAMESDVVRLTVEGLTNRQIAERLFISRRTVQTHLSHALTKLEVSSRVELAAEAGRRAHT
jgi:class 3 adenylate cyclase/DNA-binding CsgD family transcriptional regulator